LRACIFGKLQYTSHHRAVKQFTAYSVEPFCNHFWSF
jgi:hypothetical protein